MHKDDGKIFEDYLTVKGEIPKFGKGESETGCEIGRNMLEYFEFCMDLRRTKDYIQRITN